MKSIFTILFLIISSSNGMSQNLTYEEVPCLEPIRIVHTPLMGVEAAPQGVVIVTWDLATMYQGGQYNGTFAFSDIDYALNSFGHYWNIQYQRVTRGGQYHVIQANYNLGTNVAARTGNTTTLVSPTFRFYNPVQSMMVICHENRHTRSQAHHSQDGGLMGPNGGYLILNSDLGYFDRMVWKSNLRPSQEPDWLKSYFSRQTVSGTVDDNIFPLIYKH